MQNDITIEDINNWHLMQKQLKTLKENELALRQRIFGRFFPMLQDGTSTIDLTDERKLKGTAKINYRFDEAELYAIHHLIEPKLFAEGGHRIPLSSLIAMKPSLIVKNYKLLSDDSRKELDRVLIIKQSAPTLEIKEPKK